MFIKRGMGTIIGTLHDAQELSEEHKHLVQEKIATEEKKEEKVIPPTQENN